SVDDAAVVTEPTGGVEHVEIEPREVGPEPGCPHDAADLTSGEVEVQGQIRRDPGRLATLDRFHLAIQAVRSDPRVDVVEQTTELLVRERTVVAQPAREHGHAV